MDWRVWLYEKLCAIGPLITLIPQKSIHGSGSLEGPPKAKPFLVIRMEPEVPGPYPGAVRVRCSLWAHDEPGTYLHADAALTACKAGLVGAGAGAGQVVGLAGGIACVWQGNSGDLSDPDFGTIVRTSTYDLIGREG